MLANFWRAATNDPIWAAKEGGGGVGAGTLGATPDLLPPECEVGDDDLVEVGCAIRAGVCPFVASPGLRRGGPSKTALPTSHQPRLRPRR